jgi:anaerobic magnesium-protoporphyrin IX monomethyl ester cyclase
MRPRLSHECDGARVGVVESMRIVLVDIKGGDGFISKDTVVGGYGSRLKPFSKVTRVVARMKSGFHEMPSVHLGYAAALAARAGHDVVASSGEPVDGDVAIVLSSLVDYRRETAWARAMRARGTRVGFIGLASQKLPQLFRDDADFIVDGEPESALLRLVAGERLTGITASPQVDDLDSLPFPLWDPLLPVRQRLRVPFAGRPYGGSLPVLASRSCPEFCTYCPHRIQSTYRARSVTNILDELSYIRDTRGPRHIVFRDPLFSQQRDRVLELCDGIRSRALPHTFECETRLDRLDDELLGAMHRSGLRAMSFGVESVAAATLKNVGRRPIPERHQREVLRRCRELGIVTAAFYVLGFADDSWASIRATIEYAIDLGSTVAQFKILTPYPGTPLYKRMQPTITETDWQRFDGFTPTFKHPSMTHAELTFLLGSAYTQFYMRPSFLTNYLRIGSPGVRSLVDALDLRVRRHHARGVALTERTLSC